MTTATKGLRTQTRKAFLHTVFTTALEGGIGYWSFADEYSWSKGGAGAIIGTRTDIEDVDYFYAVISSLDDDWGVSEAYVVEEGEMQPITETQSLTINIDVVERGVNMLVDKVIEATKSEDPSAPFSWDYLRQFVEAWLTDGDGGDFDASVADMAVQLGLFGDLIYA